MSLDKVQVTVPLPSDFVGGYVGFGTGGFYTAQFDEFKISYGRCGYYRKWVRSIDCFSLLIIAH